MKNTILIFFVFVSSLQLLAQDLKVVNLRCEYKKDPSGIESLNPRLSWEILSDQRNVVQTAYEIIVSDNLKSLNKSAGNVWKTSKVNSGKSIQIEYKGSPLKVGTTYYWKVKVWDNKNNSSAWSPSASWQMGLLKPEDWKNAKWIAYETLADSLKAILPTDRKVDKIEGSNVLPLLRKSFNLKRPVKKATLYVCGLGHFEASLNGKKIGDHFLDPGWTKYDKQALYVPFDVTNQLGKGQNTLGVMLGNGFYYIPPVKKRYRKLKGAFDYPKMMCRLAIEYKDGSMENIISDSSWKTSASPITFSSIYGGEDYNANLEQPGWDTPTFNDQNWKQVLIVDGPPLLNSQMADPLKVFENFIPQMVTEIKQGVWVNDLGQNASGIVQIKVKGNKGDTVRIVPAELLNIDGTVNQKATGSPYYFEYILKGVGIEAFQPRFTYYGFRYVQVNGAVPQGRENPGKLPEIIELKGLHTRNAAARVGDFTSSYELFNKTESLIDWAIKSNMASVFTDCPHREKLGWLEEAHIVGSSVRYNYDIANLCKKIIDDMKFSQTEEGLVPEIAPEYVKFEWGDGMFRDSPEWGSNCIILPWYLYQWYGEEEVLEKSYHVMQKYIAYLKTKSKDHILCQGLGDWFDIGPERPGVSQLTLMGVTGTAIYFYDLNIMTDIAMRLGKKQDAEDYQKLAAKVKEAFNRTFFNKETLQYATGSQTANAMAVYMKLVEPQYKEAVVNNIVKDIRNRYNSLTAGDIGFRYLLRVLQDEGRSDVIFDMNSRSDVPGYGYQLAKGATALTESWQAFPYVSNNHFMLGHLLEWLYSGLAGIRQGEGAVAFEKIIIKPESVGDVTSAKASHHSPYGLIVSDWKKNIDMFEIRVEVPVNTTATVYIPAIEGARITEGDRDLENRDDVQFIKFENGRGVIKAGSGIYHFKVKNQQQ